MTFIKFCGLTREDDVRAACALGVDAVGFVMWPKSPRYVDASRVASLVRLLPPRVLPVGVFVSPTDNEIADAQAAGVRVVQIHGDAHPTGAAHVWIARSVEHGVADVPLAAMVVLDAHDPERHGGTGRPIDWARAAEIAATRRVLLAGGLTPVNVSDAIRQVRPFGVDVASGIEERPGFKSAPAMMAFVAAVREAEQ